MSQRTSLPRPGWAQHRIGLLLMIGYVSILMASSEGVGIPRDESFYFYAGDRAANWVDGLFDSERRSFSRGEIDRGFKYNREHPVFMKLLFGVSHRVFNERLGWIDNHVTAYRLPTMVMAGLALWLSWLLGWTMAGTMAGLFSALALMVVPRVFFHNHLACFDAPVTFMWLLIAYTFMRAARHRGWAAACGVALGFGMATKLNIFFLPFALLLVAMIDCVLHRRATGRWRGIDGERGPIVYYGWIAGSMIVLGGLVFFAHWPWLYYDTVSRVKEYVAFHARHINYPVDYLGTLYFAGPFPVHFPFVFSALTIPVGIMVLAGIGLWQIVRRVGVDAGRRFSVEIFLLVNLLVPFIIIAAPNTPIFGGVKHWMPAMPFLAVCAGIGVVRLGQGLWPGMAEGGLRLRTAAMGLLMLAPSAWATVEYGAHGPAYFNALAGGPPGAAELRMPRNFWGYSTVSVLPTINEQAEKNALVFWHKVTKWGFDRYKADTQIRGDVQYTGDWTAAYSDWAVYHDQREKMPEELDIWRAYGTDWPVDGYFVDGIQIMAVYKRPESD